MVEQLTGRVVSVDEQRHGSRLTAAASISDTVLQVAETGDFDDDNGGQVLLGGDVYGYTAVDEDALTITIDPGLTVALVEDDPVDIFDPTVGTIGVEYVALVLLDDQDPEDEPITVGIDHALFDFLVEAVRSGPAENVTLVPDGPDDYRIDQIDGVEADNLAVAAAVDLAESGLTAAQLAQAILDGAIDYYYTTSAPWADGATDHDEDLGDVWVDTDSLPQTAYRWMDRTWTELTDGGLVAVLFAAQDAQTTADGKIKHFVGGLATFGGSAPVAEGYGDIWTDTDHDNQKLYWDGDSWEDTPLGSEGIAATLIGKTLVAGASASSGERVVLRQDGSGGIIEFFTGLASETDPGYINPQSSGFSGGLEIATAATSSFDVPAKIILFAGYTGFHPQATVEGNLYAYNMTLSESLYVDGDLDFPVGGDITGVGSIQAGNLKSGSGTISGYTGSGSDVSTESVTFGAAFSSTPNVIVCFSGSGSAPAEWAPLFVYSISTTGFTVRGRRLSGSDTSVAFQWFATTA